jgi:hypothetical protein
MAVAQWLLTRNAASERRIHEANLPLERRSRCWTALPSNACVWSVPLPPACGNCSSCKRTARPGPSSSPRQPCSRRRTRQPSRPPHPPIT